jgi:UDP-3-O-[3-hydroxymyristoyl] glucosamine N-acyltransferase
MVRQSIIDKLSIIHDGCKIGAECTGEKGADQDESGVTLIGKQVEIPPDYTVCRGCVIPFGIGPGLLPSSPLRPQFEQTRPTT